MDYLDAGGAVITAGAVLWDNNLDAVEVVTLADWPATDREPAWHRTRRVRDGRESHSDGSRLAARHPFTGQLAADDVPA